MVDGAQLAHTVGDVVFVGERDADIGILIAFAVVVVAGRELVVGAAEGVPFVEGRQGMLGDDGCLAGTDFDDGDGLFVEDLREGILQGGTTVANRLATTVLRTMQMAQGNIVEGGED